MRHSISSPIKFALVFTCAALTFVAAACDSTQPKTAGTLTAVLVSPNGAEGAAVLDVSGKVDAFAAADGISLFQTPSASGTRIVLVRLTAGELSMKVTVPDASSPPQISVVQVADADNKLRQTQGYKVSFQ